MDKRRKSTKEVDDNDGVSLSIIKMAQQGGEHAGGREREAVGELPPLEQKLF